VSATGLLLIAGSSQTDSPQGVVTLRLSADGSPLGEPEYNRMVIKGHSLAMHPSLPVLATGHDMGPDAVQAGGVANTFRVEGGHLRWLGAVPSLGCSPNYSMITADGRWLVVTHYRSTDDRGSLSLFEINPDGRLAPASDRVVHADRHRSNGSTGVMHAHCAVEDPDSGTVYVADLGNDEIHRYRIDPTAGRLAHLGATCTGDHTAPRHLAVHPNGHTLYANMERGNTLQRYRVEPDGSLALAGERPTLPGDFAGRNSSAGMLLHPSLRQVLISNRGHDSIAIFPVDGETGAPGEPTWTPCGGRTPRSIGLSPDGTLLAVANQESDRVNLFVFDAERGTLTPLPTRVPCRGVVPVTIVEASA